VHGKVIFHCGAAKTGSTTIQNYLWHQRKILRRQGIHYCPRFLRSGNVDALNIAIKNMRRSGGNKAAIAQGRERLKQLFDGDGYDTVIISNESALGDPFKDDVNGFFPLHKSALESAARLFEGYAVSPVFFVRNQATMLRSFYGQRVRQGAAYSLEGFASRAQNFDLSWCPVVESLRQTFGATQTEVCKFEDFTENPAAYILGLFSKLLETEVLKVKEPVFKNNAPKSSGLAAMRSFNKGIDHLPGFSNMNRIKLKKLVRRGVFPVLEMLPGKHAGVLPAALQVDLAQQYKADLGQIYAD